MTDQTQTDETPEATEPAEVPQEGEAAETTAAAAADHPVGPEAPEEIRPPASGRDRRVLRAALRWTAAVAVFAVFGGGTAYGITRMERTDVPGLATESDGRWAYPEITRPPLPSGSPGPMDARNTAGNHYADLRALLLPAPAGATDDKALHGSDGWLAQKDFLAVYESAEDRTELGTLLTDAGLRHIAARGWTTQDGTRTAVYLLQFDTAAVADEAFEGLTQYDAPTYALRGAPAPEFDKKFPATPELEGMRRFAYDEKKPYGAEHLRQAYVVSADVLALIVQSRKGEAAAVPFQQTVVLQSQLLG